MQKKVFSNITLKLIALVLAVITWFYISSEMRRQTLGTGKNSSSQK